MLLQRDYPLRIFLRQSATTSPGSFFTLKPLNMGGAEELDGDSSWVLILVITMGQKKTVMEKSKSRMLVCLARLPG